MIASAVVLAILMPQTGTKHVLKGPKHRAAVTAMEVKVQGVATTAPTPSGTSTIVTLDIQQPTDFGLGLIDMLVTALVQSENFVMIERHNLEEVTKEQALSKDADSTAKSLGAQIIFRGAITELSFRRTGSGVGATAGSIGSYSESRSESKVGLDLKAIEVDSGRILYSVHAVGTAKSKTSSLNLTSGDIKFGNVTFNNSSLGEAVRAAISDAVKQISTQSEEVPWQAKVITVAGANSDVYINAGTKSGVKVGMKFDVREPGLALKDPDTGIVLGFTEGALVGTVRVRKTEANVCIAEPISGQKFVAGQIVSISTKS